MSGTKTDLDALVEFGFPADKAARALKVTGGLQPALDWLLTHPGELADEEQVGHQLGGSETEAKKPDNEGEINADEAKSQSLKCDDCGKLFRNSDSNAVELHVSKTGHVNFTESTTPIKPLTEEEKKEKLAELKKRLAEKREQRTLAEKEEEKSREKDRRKTGQKSLETKTTLEKAEAQRDLDAIKKEKAEERAARARIKALIEEDKKARAAKREEAKLALKAAASEEAVAASTSSNIKKEYTETRLQIRQATGAPLTHMFQATDTLQAVYDYVGQHVTGPFQLMTTFPRKILDLASNDSKTLKELDLVPSGVLVINAALS